MACGLLSSMPTSTRSAETMWRRMPMPRTMPAARSRISMSSQVIHGSHSAPLMTSVPMRPAAPGCSLMWLGKVAPPRPTMPASRSRSRSASGDSAA
jgi:hypothetical protein